MSELNKPMDITSVLHEIRVFKPRKEFAESARISSLAQYRKLYNQSIKAPEKFWGKQARNELVWFKPWKKVLQWKEPYAKWFVGGRLNVSYNCLDKWLDTSTANRAALIWEGEPATEGKPGEERVLTYKQLHRAGGDGRESHCDQARKQRSPHHRGPRCLVASGAGLRGRGVSGGETRQRISVVHPLHQRFNRQTQGDSPLDRRLLARRENHPQVCLRHSRRRRFLVHRRHRLGHGPQLRGLWPAGERRHQPAVRRGAELAGAGPFLAHRRQIR